MLGGLLRHHLGSRHTGRHSLSQNSVRPPVSRARAADSSENYHRNSGKYHRNANTCTKPSKGNAHTSADGNCAQSNEDGAAGSTPRKGTGLSTVWDKCYLRLRTKQSSELRPAP